MLQDQDKAGLECGFIMGMASFIHFGDDGVCGRENFEKKGVAENVHNLLNISFTLCYNSEWNT